MLFRSDRRSGAYDGMGNCQRKRRVSVRGEGQGLYAEGSETAAGIYGISESAGRVWGAVREGESASIIAKFRKNSVYKGG